MSNIKSDIPEITSRAEARYITKRKIKAMLNSICFYICRFFPIKNNLISVCTFEGKGGFGCNPKYIVKELHKRNPNYKFIWLVNNMESAFPDYIKIVPNSTLSRAYWLSRSRVWIDNYRKPLGTVKRKGQYYINTWHANMGFKSIGLWRGRAFSRMAYLVSNNDSQMIDRVVIDSTFCEVLFRKGLLYYGKYLYTGQPRCDVLYGDKSKYRALVREQFSLPYDANLIMHAPTFREMKANENRSVYVDECSLDYERLLKALEERFGGEWYVILRLHPQLNARALDRNYVSSSDRIIDASKNNDMYELMAGIDVFLTDYSSAAFDACCGNIPVFTYMDDISKYQEDRGTMLWDFDHLETGVVENNKTITPGISAILPFKVARNNDELEECIKTFDMQDYLNKTNEMKRAVQMVFDGKASERVADDIENTIRKKVASDS